jgi:RHS repeat-associated protein
MTTVAICATREVLWGSSFYRGEQYDSDLSLYYLRARYYNPNTGRFLSRDPEDGYAQDPTSLHKYLYAGGDPINGSDPTGRAIFVGLSQRITALIHRVIAVRWISMAVVPMCAVATGRWPGHRPRRITLTHEKLWPVHRSFIAMSGPGAPGASHLGTWDTSNRGLRLLRQAGGPHLIRPRSGCPILRFFLERDAKIVLQLIIEVPRGLKPQVLRPFSARLKLCPDTVRHF